MRWLEAGRPISEGPVASKPSETSLGPPREWRIHLGAHKTATTHVQDTLLAARGRLQQDGVDFLPRGAVRPILWCLLAQRRWKRIVGRALLGRDFWAKLLDLRERGDVIALSEENLLGGCADLLCHPLYPDFEERLRNVIRHTRGAPVRLFLSIRSFDRVLPAAYVTALRYNMAKPSDLESALTAAWIRPPRWTELVDRIHRTAPQSELRVWRQEDYGQHSRAILSAFLGRDAGELPDLPPPTITITPSAAAVAEVERMIVHMLPKLSASDWTRWVNATYAILPAETGADRFYPVKPALAEKLKDAYSQDTEALRAAGLLIEPWRLGGLAAA